MNTLPPEIAAEGEQATPGQRRLAASRAALEEIFAPQDADAFPRSQTMRFLMGGKGRVAALGLFAGLALVKPKLAVGLVRFLPLGQLLPVARNLLKALR